MNILKVVDFTEYPGLRHCSVSDDSGEEFYHTKLNYAFKDAYEKKEKLNVNLDFTAGYAPSFLDEAFGNLIYDFGLEVVENYLDVTSNEEPDLISVLINETYPEWEERRKKGDKPKITGKWENWFCLKEGNLKTRIGNA